jgi:alcohol dehydrogenase (cytochrome c)
LAVWIAGVALLLAGSVAYAANVYLKAAHEVGQSTTHEMWARVTWRAQFYALKLRGGVPEFSWAEILAMTRQRTGFGLAGVIRDRRGLDGSVVNPFITDDDREAGSNLYREHCASCHAADGGGWHGPRLNRSGLRHGDSDFAIYKVIRDGVPQTAMIPVPMSLRERWQLVGFVRSLQMHGHAGHRKNRHLGIDVSSEQLLSAGTRTDEWLSYSGSLDGRRYSLLKDVTPANASQLQLKWSHQFNTVESRITSTPIVVNNVMFITEPPSNVYALDVRTGELIWKYMRNITPAALPICCGVVNRGVAIWKDTVFLGSLDGYLVAIDANTGHMRWQTPVANTSDGFVVTVAPLIVNDLVIVGVAGGEYGIRGYLTAFDAMTGVERWRFYTIPGEGEPGHETWQGDAWRSGGGSTWITGSYDPSLDLIYWGVGNPSPDFSKDVRPGDNLYTDSVIALQAKTGKLAWYFQFTPSDDHDWDSAQTPILADVIVEGARRKVICWANRNGFYYVLDRETGKFLTGVPFVDLNWTEGLDAKGKPIPLKAGAVLTNGRLTKPGVGGGTNWQNAAFDPQQSLVFVHAAEGASVFTKSPNPRRGELGVYMGSAGSMIEPPRTFVRALDAATGARKWELESNAKPSFFTGYSGLLATVGGLVFGGSKGDVFAVNSKTGGEVWRVPLGGETVGPPITFSVDGKQVIAVPAGRALFVFGL